MVYCAALIVSCVQLLIGASVASGAPEPADQAALVEKLAPSLVRVEYTLQYDKGEAPQAPGWIQRCPNCGQFHVNDAEGAVREERPVETAGFLLSPTQVIAPDPLAHPRYIKATAVRFGDVRRPARAVAYAKNQNAVILEMDGPLDGAVPLSFDATKKGPYLAVVYARQNGPWAATVEPLVKTVSVTQAKERFGSVSSNVLIVDRTGAAVGMCMNETLPLDESWKGSPAKWPAVSAEEMSQLLSSLEKRCGQAVPRVVLRFRSPREQNPADRWRSYAREGDEEDATERNVPGVLVDEKTILVLADLPPKVTARLERIVVHPADGKPVTAKFLQSLRDYGCLVAQLESPLSGAAVFSSADILSVRNAMLLSADVKVQGDKRVVYFGHGRIPAFEVGWRQDVYPQARGGQSDAFLFDLEGRLVAMPVVRRQKVTVKEEWSSGSGTTVLAPATQIREVLADLAKYTDPNNTPLGEDEENRLAWIGVELQGMDRELARANNVSDLTSDGQMGALVTYVYPDSPAAKAGVEAGFILLRLHVPGQPKPLEIKLMDTRFGGMDGFPWDKLDEVPAEYLDQIPTPWSSAENSFTRALTDIGVGQKYTAEFFHNGEVVKKDFVVVLGPRHYGSAPRYKSRSLGLTVRDLTYEVRRYFRTEAGDLGVIVSKIEPGGKAAIAGIMPYEIITHVDGTPVMNVKDLEKAIGKEGELRLSVKRRTLGRQVKINMTAGAEQGGPETRPASGMRGRLRDRLSGAMKRATTQKRPASTQPANAEEGEE